MYHQGQGESLANKNHMLFGLVNELNPSNQTNIFPKSNGNLGQEWFSCTLSHRNHGSVEKGYVWKATNYYWTHTMDTQQFFLCSTMIAGRVSSIIYKPNTNPKISHHSSLTTYRPSPAKEKHYRFPLPTSKLLKLPGKQHENWLCPRNLFKYLLRRCFRHVLGVNIPSQDVFGCLGF